MVAQGGKYRKKNRISDGSSNYIDYDGYIKLKMLRSISNLYFSNLSFLKDALFQILFACITSLELD